ncbi:MAG: HAD family hydrolase [Frisingicoccus sp.]|nr:HAD family hydrolase [Frisingicoccus sp.]
MIKLIVSDIDGTLVPEGTNDINPEIFSLIRQLKSKGIYFAVASGRHKCSVEKLFEPVQNDIFYITSNGAYAGTYDKKLIVSDISKEIQKTLRSNFEDDLKLPYIIETCNAAYTNCPDPEFTRILTDGYGYQITPYHSVDEITEDIIKFSLYHPENVSEIDETWHKKWNKICKSSVSGTHWIDFMAEGTNKGNALAQLQEGLGITIQETIAFGDQINDIEMLKQAYFSFAMENSSCVVKNAARFVCESCENDGVVQMIRSIIKNSFSN